MSAASRQRFLASLNRCEARANFLPDFYRRFMDSSEEVRQKFADTDLGQQVRHLRRTLELSAAATEGEREGLSELTMRAGTHDHAHLDIRPALYELWQQALLGTAADCDPDWDADTEAAWREVLGFMVRFMTARY